MSVSKKKLFAYGIGVYGLTTAAAFIYVKSNQQDNETEQTPSDCNQIKSDAHRQKVFNSIAKNYDKDIGLDETLMGLNLLRWWHLRRASGKVLEVASGTGRNFSYYPNSCKVTATDACPDMVQQALHKAKTLGPGSAKVEGVGVMDATKLDFEPESFDTVIDTHGLCSVENPDKVLQEMRRVCKKDGQILLLEHGISHYAWLNRLLEKNAHRKSRGPQEGRCVFNWRKSGIFSTMSEEFTLSILNHSCGDGQSKGI